MERSDIRVLHCEGLLARSSCHLRVFSSSSSWRLGKSPDLASLDPGYVHVVSASTRQSRYFHCKEQARNNGPLVSATGSLYRHPRMQERCPVAWPARAAGASSAFALVKRHGLSLSVVARKYAARGLGSRARNKKPGAISRPGGWRTFGEYAFLEDSCYTSQENYEGNLMRRSFLRFLRGSLAGRERLCLNASRLSARGCARGTR
jgi:hypothetical protein